MLAVRITGFGGPEVVAVDQVPDPPPPGGDEILVQVDASSINGTDLGVRRGAAKVAAGRLPYTLGFDLAGHVLACGPRVTAFRPGDRVVALLGHGGGAQAERVLVRQGRAALAPTTVSSAEAATLPLAGLTALQALYRQARITGRPPPARVLVVGASGGIGSYAVQLAKLAGAHVTGVASRDKQDHVLDLGADAVLDRSDALPQTGETWDVVLDTPGAHRFADVRPHLRPDGVLVSTRAINPDLVTLAALRRRSHRPRFAVVTTRARSQDLAQLVALVDRGALRPVLTRTFPLRQAAAAHRHAEHGSTGKVAVEMSRDEPDQR